MYGLAEPQESVVARGTEPNAQIITAILVERKRRWNKRDRARVAPILIVIKGQELRNLGHFVSLSGAQRFGVELPEFGRELHSRFPHGVQLRAEHDWGSDGSRTPGRRTEYNSVRNEIGVWTGVVLPVAARSTTPCGTGLDLGRGLYAQLPQGAISVRNTIGVGTGVVLPAAARCCTPCGTRLELGQGLYSRSPHGVVPLAEHEEPRRCGEHNSATEPGRRTDTTPCGTRMREELDTAKYQDNRQGTLYGITGPRTKTRIVI